MTIFSNIKKLSEYALEKFLITEEDVIYTQNKLLELFHLDGFEPEALHDEPPVHSVSENEISPDDKLSSEATDTLKCKKHPRFENNQDLETILNEMLDYAAEKNIFEDSGITSRDLFDTKIMGQLVPPPSDVIDIFQTLYTECGAKSSTDWFYKFSGDTNYIRRNRIKNDVKWQTETKYGNLDITINLSKPEKDPKAIAAAKNMKQGGYPSCLLCKENEGYSGRMNHAARQNLRIIPLHLNGEKWYFQYSPYVYFNEHCIVFSENHTPMKIEKETFQRLLDFVSQFPHYTLGSNADLPIVGGSILTHNHFQGGNYIFPMAKAGIKKNVHFKKFPKVKAGILNWPMSVIRLKSKHSDELVQCASHILDCWKIYSDETAFIFSETDGELHNTITPIARKRNGTFELDLVLRNNITTDEHPLGVFHPHKNLHHIKKENIGLIEVMGLAVLPSRLKSELSLLKEFMCSKKDISKDERISKHGEWANEILRNHPDFNETNADEILKQETGLVFAQVLEDSGVFKCTEEGLQAFEQFIEFLNKN